MSLKHQIIRKYITDNGAIYKNLDISYEVFGPKINTAPIVLVNHALTGNSDVISKSKGWWKELIGNKKLIDTNRYTIIAINIVGNGYGNELIDNYKDFTTKDIARIYFTILQNLNINKLHSIIGGSLGGGIAWEMAVLYPKLANYIIPIASDWKSSDWIIGHNYVQENILLNSKAPLQDAREMAMLFYRTPSSFTQKFDRTRTDDNKCFNVESWLKHHGEKLKARFDVKSYLMMNNLLTTINILQEGKTINETLASIKSKIIQIAVNSDLFFVAKENIQTKKILDELNISNEYHEIKSEDGHDAFLIEHEQISIFLNPIFN